jgi:hypothetical protein
MKQRKLCAICAERAIMTDQVGLVWCEDHRFRGDFLNWGVAHGWPEMNCETYAIAQGKYFWYIAAALGVEDMIWLMLVVIEQWEKEEVA